MEKLPLYISGVFVLTTVLTVYFLFKATQSRILILIAFAWLLIQSVTSLPGFYTVTDTTPPRFLLLVVPPLAAIIILFISPAGRKWMGSFDTRWLTWVHVVRIPVEIVLLWLFMHQQVPELMTFEGRNFDILSGLTAPLIAWLGYTKGKISKPVLLLWNFICLGLLFNIVINAILSAPFPFQRFAFDQPNVAILHFPFVWLPGFIVPVVLLSHLVCIRQLLRKNEKTEEALPMPGYITR